MLSCLLVLSAVITTAVSRLERHQIGIAQFVRQGSFHYLTRMGFAVGTSQINVTLKMTGQIRHNEQHSLFIGLLMDNDYEKLQNTPWCINRERLFKDTRMVWGLQGGEPKEVTMKFSQPTSEHIWYLYLFSCKGSYRSETENDGLKLQIDVLMINNNSHFSGDQDSMMWIYMGVLVVAIALVPNNLQKLKKDLKEDQKDWGHMLILVGIMGLAASYIYKLVHLISYSSNGIGFPTMDMISTLIKTVSQSLVVGLLVSIASGWSITHFDEVRKRSYLYFGVMLVAWNVIAAVLAKLRDRDFDKFHFYDCQQGLVILIVRTLLVVLFVGCSIKTYKNAKPKTRKFIREFSVLGFVYIAGYPIAVTFCELFLPVYKQHQGVTAITQVTHVVANSLLTYMVTSRRSSYSNLQLASSTFLTPIDPKYL